MELRYTLGKPEKGFEEMDKHIFRFIMSSKIHQLMTTQKRILKFSDLKVPLILLVLCVLAYGLLIPTLGYYWDDWPYAWINHMYGPAGYPDYVALDRPYSAWIFMLLAFIFGEQPLGYHISSLLLYWLCSVLFWLLTRLIWPEQKKEALWGALLFAIYPGFLGHPQAIIYNHHFAAMALYLFSFIGMVKALQVPSEGKLSWRAAAWHITAMISLVISQFTIEYFLGWELVRPLLIWLVIRKKAGKLESRVGAGILQLVPYWLVSCIFVIWRVFVFKFPTYQPLGVGESEFILSEWLVGILTQFWEAVFGAWEGAFLHLSRGEFSYIFWISYLVLSLIAFVSILVVLLFYKRDRHGDNRKTLGDHKAFGFQALIVGLTGLVFAGWTFWLTNLNIDVSSPFKSRFTMAFIPWVALFFTAILHFIAGKRSSFLRVVSIIIIALLVGGATGAHFWNANVYRHEWLVTQRYFRQLVERMPGIEPGTSLVINDLQTISLNEDDSLTAILNWTYSPDHTDSQIDYMVQYLSLRLGREIPALEPGLMIEQPLRSVHFTGSTDQIMVVYYEPPGCLRVLDDAHPERIPEDFPDRMLPALSLSNLSLIQTDAEERVTPPLNLFGMGSEETWCMHFQEAELAAQRGDWGKVGEIGDKAFRLEDQTNEPTELFVFLEGYLRDGRLDNALRTSNYLSERGAQVYDPVVCELWREIESATGGFPVDFNITEVYGRFCSGE
jgi:hypothetical protein